MRKNGYRRIEIGDHIKIGMEVLIPKGLKFGTIHPQMDGGTTRRAQRTSQASSHYAVSELTWPGTGGYWKWVPKTECFVMV